MLNKHRAKTLVLLYNEVANAIRASGGPVFIGDAAIDYLCGACGAPLCVGMKDGDLAGIVFICGCGAYNRVPSLANDPEELATVSPS